MDVGLGVVEMHEKASRHAVNVHLKMSPHD